MSRYYPSMKKFSWIIPVCLIIGLLAGFALSKIQPSAYVVSSTLLVSSIPSFGTTTSGIGTSTTDTLSQSVNDAAEIPTRSVMYYVYNTYDPQKNGSQLRARGFTADDLVLDVTAINPSTTQSTISVTATASKPSESAFPGRWGQVLCTLARKQWR